MRIFYGRSVEIPGVRDPASEAPDPGGPGPAKTRRDRIRVLIAHSQPIFRTGVRTLLKAMEGVDVAAEAADVLGAVDLVRRMSPEVVVTEAVEAKLDGLDLARVVPS